MPGDHHPKYKSCVSKVKAKGGDVNPYAVCHSSTGETKTQEKDYPWSQCQADQKKAGHGKDSANKICGSIKAKYGETIIREKLNANRQVPYPNPPIKPRRPEPTIQKTPKGIGGSTKNPVNQDVWKKILDSQLRRNADNTRTF